MDSGVLPSIETPQGLVETFCLHYEAQEWYNGVTLLDDSISYQTHGILDTFPSLEEAQVRISRAHYTSVQANQEPPNVVSGLLCSPCKHGADLEKYNRTWEPNGYKSNIRII